MGYQPGPLILQSADHVGTETTDYKFADDAHDQLSDLETLPGSWDTFLSDAAILLAEPSNPFPDVAIDGVILELVAQAEPAVILGTDALFTAFGDAAEALGNAIAYSPAESWSSLPAPFVAPAPAEKLGVPAIPPEWLSVSVQGTVPTTPLIPTTPGLSPGNPAPVAPVVNIPAPAPVAPITGTGAIGGLRGR